jgi:peroxiredoxin
VTRHISASGRAALAAIVLAAGGTAVRAGGADADWKELVELDAGPQQKPQNAAEARDIVLAHLAKQDKALRAFLAAHPKDAHAFEARLRLARLLQLRGGIEDSDKLRAEGKRVFDELEKTATPEQKVEVDFSKITRMMRSLRQPTQAQRDDLLTAARKFQHDHAGDHRIAALLAEVAVLFDAQPKIKAALLTDAQSLATDEELKHRVADDLKRVELVGREVSQTFPALNGGEINLSDLRGKPLLIIFFAEFSPPSLTAIATVQRAVAELPRGSVQVLGVCLDEKRAPIESLTKARGIAWPIAFDGKGWESPVVRTLGINALPTVWLLDERGRLRSLNALDGTVPQVRQLLR